MEFLVVQGDPLPGGNGEYNPQVIDVMTKAMLRQTCRAKDITDGTSKTLLLPVDAGTGWADPDSGFTVNTEPVINHVNDGEI